ncbi:BamA/TamA family outer membrane protein [Enterovirga sp. GCM10030262]|uniref:autotransporter assembly complex protein TamA n=1 Tax=Enterovirga sp. GCM10030262 TaxID=3273391 RepID=UPI00360A4717
MIAIVAGGTLTLGGVAHAQPVADEPVISDEAFESRLPPLDPALGEPLQPIGDFEGPAVPVPAEPVPDAALPDPALAQPLPPLSTFDVTTPEATDDGDATELAPVRYSLTVEGLDEVGLAGRFRDLSALEQADGEAANGAMIAARAREDEALAIRLLRSEGYYDGTAVAAIEQVPEQPGRLRVVLTAAPGQRYDFGEIALPGPETVPPGLPRSELPLKSGDPIVAAIVEGAEANLMLRLPEQGYPFVEIGPRDVLLDPATGLGDYTLPVEPGPRVRFGGYRTTGDLAFDASHVGVLARFERGALYDSRKVDDLREAMVATNLFSSVSAEPVRTGETAPDGTEYVDILVRQDAGPPRSLTATGGFSTGQGFRLEGAWEHRNLFPPEGSLRVAAVAGTKEQSLGVTFRRSNAGKRDRTLLLTLEAGRRDYPAYEGYTALLSGRIARESTPIWHKRWTWAYGAELIATNESRFRRRDFNQPSDTYFIGGLVGQIGYDTSDSLLNPTSGFRLLARANPEVSLKDGANPYIRNLIDGSAYYPVSEDLVIAGRARFGSIYGIERSNLAPSRRLYAGGGGSVRGFGYQELGPKDSENNPIGGRSLTEFALEGRYRFGNYGAVAFIDAGQVYESQTPRLSDLRYGIGVGGRLYTNFGPLRVDVATPINRQPGESRISLYISIGQAF